MYRIKWVNSSGLYSATGYLAVYFCDENQAGLFMRDYQMVYPYYKLEIEKC